MEKKFLFLGLLLILVLSCGGGTGQQALEELITMAKNDNLEGIAKLIVYHGMDKDRDYKDALDISDPEDKNKALAMKELIKIAINESDSYEFGASEKEDNWDIIEVKFIKGDEEKIMYFGFINVNGKLLLGDVDY